MRLENQFLYYFFGVISLSCFYLKPMEQENFSSLYTIFGLNKECIESLPNEIQEHICDQYLGSVTNWAYPFLQIDEPVKSSVSAADKIFVSTSEDFSIYNLHGEKLSNFKYGWVSNTTINHKINKILTISYEGEVTIRSFRGEIVNFLKQFDGSEIKSAIFSNKTDKILTISLGNSAELWNQTGYQLVKFKHKSNVNSAKFNKLDNLVLTASDDCTAKLWDISGEELVVFEDVAPVLLAEFNQKEDLILTTSNSAAKLYDISGILVVIMSDENPITFANFNSEGNLILTGSYNYVTLWDLSGNKILKLCNSTPRFLTGLFSTGLLTNVKAVFNPAGNKILSYEGCFAKLCSVNGKKIAILKNSGLTIRFAKFNEKGDIILTGSSDVLRLWKLYKPNLGQILLHRILISYIFIKRQNQNMATSSLLQKISKDFRLNFFELQNIWRSFPKTLRRAMLESFKRIIEKYGKRQGSRFNKGKKLFTNSLIIPRQK